MNYMISYSWTKNEDEKEKTFTKDSDKDLVKAQHQPQTYVSSYPYGFLVGGGRGGKQLLPYRQADVWPTVNCYLNVQH